MLRRATVALFLGGILAGSSPAAGDDDPEAPAARPEANAAPKREGQYSGVDPDKPAAEPEKGRKKKAAPGTLTWVGFSADSGEVFFQGSSRFAASQRLEGATLVVDIEGLSRMAPNTRRPLETRFFDTPIARVTVRAVKARRGSKKVEARKAGIEVRIAFKEGAKAREGSLRSDAGAEGAYTVHLDMAASTAATSSD
jgi:hypothetical protein